MPHFTNNKKFNYFNFNFQKQEVKFIGNYKLENTMDCREVWYDNVKFFNFLDVCKVTTFADIE